jgi:phage terminase large subunit-like protein
MGEQKHEPHDTNNGNDDRETLCLIQCPWGIHGWRSGEETIAFPSNQLHGGTQRDETYFLGDGRTYDRQKGELLHPEHEPAHVLAELKREMGPIAFSAQYQQSPVPPGGTIIMRKWLTPYDDVKRQSGDRIIMSWDIALSEAETGDYSACVVLLRRNEVYYILEVVRGRFPFDALKRKVIDVKQRYGSSTLLIEDSPISRGLIQSLREQSINVTCYKPDTDKRARVIAQIDLFAGARFVFPGVPVGSRNSPPNYSLFPGATTIRSTPSPRAWRGVVTDGAKCQRASSVGCSEGWPVQYRMKEPLEAAARQPPRYNKGSPSDRPGQSFVAAICQFYRRMEFSERTGTKT